MQVSRRELFKYAAAGTAAAGSRRSQDRRSRNAGPATLIDYSAGVPSPLGIRAAATWARSGTCRIGVRVPSGCSASPCSSVRPRPWRRSACRSSPATSFGKGQTSDWRGGFDAGIRHAQRGLELHRAAGGPENCPIYASIDDKSVAVGVRQPHRALPAGLGGGPRAAQRRRVRQHADHRPLPARRDRGTVLAAQLGTPAGYVHPAAHLHQFEIDKRQIEGIGIDLNSILKPQYGQWSAQKPFFLS